MRLTTILEMTRCGSSSYKGESSKFEKRHSNAVLKTSTSSTCVRNQVAQFNWPSSTIQVSFFFSSLSLLWGLSLFPVFCAPYIRPSFLEPCRSSLVLLKLLKCWDREHGLKPYSSDLNRFYSRSCSASGERPCAENIRRRWAGGRHYLPPSRGLAWNTAGLRRALLWARSEIRWCQVLHNSVQTGCGVACQGPRPRHFVPRLLGVCVKSRHSERGVVLLAQKWEDNEELSSVCLSMIFFFFDH